MQKPKIKLSTFRRYKEYFILALILSGLVFLGVETFGHLTAGQIVLFEVFEYVTSAVFIIDFVYELIISPHRGLYLKYNWFYLLAAIPLPYAAVDLLRGLRLIRVVRLLRLGVHFEYEESLRHSK